MNVKSKSGSGIFAARGMLAVVLILGLGILLIFLGSAEGGESEGVMSTEESIEKICSSIEGVGECRVLVSYKTEAGAFGSGGGEVIVGIAVVCEGGGSDNVRRRVTEVLSGLYGIGANRIRVEKLK